MKTNWLQYTAVEQLKILSDAERAGKLNVYALEKDWWVTQVLRALKNSVYYEHIAFKGGTSLSKGWDLIERFSEDVDISISRAFLGFGGKLSKNQISDRLRRASCSFVRNELRLELEKCLLNLGIPPELFEVKVNLTDITTTDPEVIEILYQSVLQGQSYLPDKIKLEVGARSELEPAEYIILQSVLAQILPESFSNEAAFEFKTVLPTRTFLEKLFLLHEEFAKPENEIRTDRMSRHLYDIEKLSNTRFAQSALGDTQLYMKIIEYRQQFIGLKNFD